MHHIKKITHHAHRIVHKHRHLFLAYVHVLLLVSFLGSIHVEHNIFADEEVAPDVPVASEVVVNESMEVVNSEQLTGGSEQLTGGSEQLTGGSEQLTANNEQQTGDILTGESLFTGDVLTGETTTGEIFTGEIVVGEALTGEQNSEPLSVIYPSQRAQRNGSGYVAIDSLESVITTGGEIGVTYCSRITYENIFRILKAGVRTTDSALARGDVDHLIIQGIINNTLIEVTQSDLQNIFSGDLLSSAASVYDVYATFFVDGKIVYHRISVLYGDDGGRYVLDPLRGSKTLKPQKLDEYLKYYDDEINVHRYIGQSYSPLIVKNEISFDTGFIENIQKISGKILSGNKLIVTSSEYLVPSIGEIATGEIETGDVVLVYSGNDAINTGENVVIETQIQEVTKTPEVIQTSEVVPQEVINTGVEGAYFDQAYALDQKDIKIEILQGVLISIDFYSGSINGIYDSQTMEAVYQFQLDRGILTLEDDVGLRGYMGPNTRNKLNEELRIKNVKGNNIVNTGEFVPAVLPDLVDNITGEVNTGEVVFTTRDIELLNSIGTVSGLNNLLFVFDPFANSALYNNLLNDTGVINPLSGYTYNTGDTIGLVFDTLDSQAVINYLTSRGYGTGEVTLVPVDYSALIGNGTLNFSQMSGQLLVPIVLQSMNVMSGQTAEVEIPEGAVLKTAGGDNFTGDLMPPKFLDPDTLNVSTNENIISAIDVGSDQHITFEDASGDSVNALFRVPVPGASIGDVVSVNYSEDGKNRTYLDAAGVVDINGEPYVTFQANHFTTFYMGTLTGSFVINNDASYATGLAVTLNMNISGASQMRFGNSIVERDAAIWTGYQTGFSWNLTGTDDIKRVYAQFSGGGYVRGVADNIIFDTSSGAMTSGLQAYLDSSTGGILFTDKGPRNLIFTGVGGAKKTTWSGEDVVSLNGISQYVENTSGFIAAYPFTISAWVKPAVVNVTQTITMFGNSATNTTFYGIRLVGANAVAVGSNTSAISATSAVTMAANKRYHVIGVFASATSRTIYVDNRNPVTSATTSVTFAPTNPRRRVGRHPGTSTTNYFSGSIDEIRVYNTALTTGDRQNLYMIPPTFDPQTAFTGTPTLYGELTPKMRDVNLVISGITYHTTGAGNGKWMTSPMITGLANGTYTVTLNYTNVYGKTGATTYMSGLVINSTGANITYSLATTTTGNVIATLTGLDPTYLIVNNLGSEFYTFTGNGSFVWQYVDKQGTTGSTTAIVNRIKSSWLTYSPTTFYENQATNDGSVSGNMIVTLGTGAFNGEVANYLTLTNVPAGLTGVYTLSGINNLIIMFSGNAINNGSGDSIGNVILTFLTGAFSGFNPSDVINPSQTGISINFYDPNPVSGLVPADDTMIDADTNPAGVGNCADGKCQRMNYGTISYICASDFGSKNLFRFNLASLPTGAVITSAKLNLYRYQINGATDATGFTIKKIINNAGWIEGTQNAATALTGEPNYIQRKGNQEYWYNGSPGMQAGLDYATTNLISSVGFTGSNNGSYNQDFPFNSNGISLLQDWANGAENQGLVMGDIPVTTDHWLCIRSKEAADSGQRPRLAVTYYMDSVTPSLTSTSPANNETGVAVNSNLFMYFSENVYARTGYNITIRKLVDGSLVENINTTNTGKVIVSANEVKIIPNTGFLSNMGYYIEVASGAFKDRAENIYLGFTGSSTWKFTTVNISNLPNLTGAYFTGIFATTGIFGATITTGGGSVITERGFCWSINQGFNGCPTKVSETGASFGTGLFTLPISGFPAGTQIYFKAIAVNANGMAYSPETGFLTRPAKVMVSSPSKIDNDSFLAHRDIVTGASTYNIYLSTDSGFASYLTGYGPRTGLTGTFFKVIGLNATTLYYYKISAVNSGGEGQPSDMTGATTTFYPTPIAWLKFEETVGTNALDLAEGSYHDGILFGSPTMNQTGIDHRAFCYDGINDDVNIVNFNYGSRYTIGFWFSTKSTGDNMHIFSHGGDTDSSSINVILDHATQTMRTYVNGNQSLFILGSSIYNGLIDGNRHYYTISVDNNGAVTGKYNIIVYVDGLYQLIDSSLNSSTYSPANNLVLGRVSNMTGGYYKGCIDDFRIFDQVLSTGEIGALYNQLSLTPLSSLSLTGPSSLDFGVWNISDVQQVIQTTFTGNNNYFKVIDGVGAYSGYYTTLSMSNFTNSNGDTISNSNMAIKVMSGVQMLSGTTNINVFSAITGVYQTFGTGPMTFIQRNAGSGAGILGTYGTLPTFKIILPALQNYGNYTGTITYTLY